MKSRVKNIIIVITASLLVFPVIFLLLLAVGSTWRFPSVFPSEFKWNNFRTIFSQGSLVRSSFFTSAAISLVVCFLSTATGFIISKIIAFHPKRNLLLFCAYLPFVISPVIYAACLNYYFVVAGLNATATGVIIAQFIITFPYAVILFSSHWNRHLLSMQELTETLGGNIFQTYRKVLIPISKNILLIVFFQTFLISWFEFGLTNFIGAGRVQTLTIRVYQYIGDANIYLAAVSGLLLVIPPLILLWLNKKFVFSEYHK